MNSTRSWVVFGAAVFAYVVGVTQRTSLGVLGVDATERFDVAAATLSTVAVVQIIVYAALQIPVGLLADRIGPRTLIVVGAALMAGGQALLAGAEVLPVVFVARILVAMGDAMTFVSVVRLLPNWFRGRILPQLSQWVGVLGQLGQVIATVPFAILLHMTGWQPALLMASGLSLLAVVVALALLRPGEPPPLTSPVPVGGPLRQLAAIVRRPGTQLGFWAHLVCGTAPTVMALIWGYPFLTAALGLGISEAAGVFSLMVVGTVVAGPVIGYLMARFPLRRSNLVMTVVVGILLIWIGVILWPGEPPLWLVGVLFFAIGTGGPGSLIGFDIARTTNPSHALGSASGLVNVGGFLGGFVAVFGIGLVLDIGNAARVAAGTAPDLYALESFRIAFLVPVVVIAIGIVAMLIARRRTRRWMFESEGIQIAPLWVALFRSRRASRRSAKGG